MDKDRLIGSAKVVKGKVKEAEGEVGKVESNVQIAVGVLKGTLRGE